MLQLEEGTIDLFLKTVKDNCLAIDLEVAPKPRTIDVYVQAWLNRVWEHGFMGIFKRKDSYNKTKAFKDQKQTDLAVK
jgi:selenophosphate synthetase-related protein